MTNVLCLQSFSQWNLAGQVWSRITADALHIISWKLLQIVIVLCKIIQIFLLLCEQL